MEWKYERENVMWWDENSKSHPTPFYLSRRLNMAGQECGYVLGVKGCYEGLLPVLEEKEEAELLMRRLSKWYKELPPGCKSLSQGVMCLKQLLETVYD